MSKIVYQTDAYGIYIGSTIADESPLEPGVFHIPAGCVDIAPLPDVDGKLIKWVNDEWAYEDIPEPEIPEQIILTKEKRISILQDAYEIDREKLNRAWLAAMIADGANEDAKKNAIVAQMNALDEQLELDILSVLSEE